VEKRIELGSRVRAGNEDVGTIEKIVVDPEEQAPGYVVVRRGRVRPRQIVVPVSLVQDVSPDEVTLEISPEALDSFPDYESSTPKGRYERPTVVGYPRPVGTYTPLSNQAFTVLHTRSVPESHIGVRRGMAVVGADGTQVGRVDGLIAEPESRRASQIVLRQGPPVAPRYRLVPTDLVGEAREGSVQLRISAEHVAGLAAYEPETEREAK
jgi:sporulation protein YlmC with PRC-barrel domain